MKPTNAIAMERHVVQETAQSFDRARLWSSQVGSRGVLEHGHTAVCICAEESWLATARADSGLLVQELLGLVDFGGQIWTAASIGVVE